MVVQKIQFKLLVVTNPQETSRFYAAYWKLLDFIPRQSEMGLSKCTHKAPHSEVTRKTHSRYKPEKNALI